MKELSYYWTYLRIRGAIPWICTRSAILVHPLLCAVLPFKKAVAIRASLFLGYRVNIDNPRTFNERILHRKFYAPDDVAATIADKWRVRGYVADAGYEHILNEVYHVTEDPDDVPFDRLPDRFVVKANYGYAMNILVDDKARTDRASIAARCSHWLMNRNRFFRWNPELHYRKIEPKLIFEKYLTDSTNDQLVDYKMFCFHGNVEFIAVHMKANGVHATASYDCDWNRMPFALYGRPVEIPVKKPGRLSEMIRIAERLSKGFDFLRVDLYYINDRDIVFGELTYNPSGGACRFFPRRYDALFGRKL